MGLFAPEAVECAEVDEDVDQSIAVGNSVVIAKFGAFNAESFG